MIVASSQEADCEDSYTDNIYDDSSVCSQRLKTTI